MKKLNEYLNKLNDNNIEHIYQIIKTFSKNDLEFMGPRSFYDDSQYRKIEWINNQPVAYLEVKIYREIGKLNIGVHSKYRKIGITSKLFKKCLPELKKLGIKKLISSVSKKNISSQRFHEKLKFKKIIDSQELLNLRLTNQDSIYYKLDIM